MGETKWTEEQLSAINTRNCNLLVAAAAGSGKTAVLVERIIKIITNEKNPIDIDKLLVVTFTNAAASEMRERIADAISRELDKNPNSKNLQKQLTLLNRSNIMTMHSFCLNVIKNNFHKIDLDPSFRIADQTEIILIRKEVIDELFENKYDDDDNNFINLVEYFSTYKSDDNLKDLILDLYNFIMSGPWPEKWLRDSAEAFNIQTIEDLNETKWIKVLISSIKVELQGYIKMFEQGINLINSTEGLEPYLENFHDELSYINNVYINADNGIEELHKSICSIQFNKLKTVKKDKVLDENIQDAVKKIRDDIKKKISDLVNNTFSISLNEIILNINGAYKYVKQLTEIIIEFKQKFSLKKKERNIVDFNDLEHFCLDILIDYDEDGNNIPSSVSKNFKDYFEEVLVDEYQDSNNVQEAIIGLVSRRDGNMPNVFMVGDVKQSIYRFRQAKPELFINKYNSYNLESGLNRKIQLYKNFRSREEILNGVNYIFKNIMSRTVGELEYTADEALNLGASYVSNKEDKFIGNEIEVNIIDKNSDDNLEEEIEEDLEAVNLEGRLIARRIKELMSSDNGLKILDKNTGEYRNLKYNDIVILLRATKNWSQGLIEELGSEGIPVYADTGTGYFESIEIRTIMSLLKIIDNPMQDVPMVAVLKCPIMGFNADELSDIRLINKEKYFYENIKHISEYETFSIELREKCNYLLDNLNNWREKSKYMAIDEFIWYLYMDTSYYAFVGAMPNGILRQANLKILFQRAKQFEDTSFKGVFNFINFINKLTKSSGDMGSAKILGENEDVVRIMSIHKSKGLEFPVVFLCETGKNFNLMDLNKNILYHDELGIGPDFIDLDKRLSIGTIAKDSIKRKIKLESLSEEIRILYVACTRAKEKLIVLGSVKNLNKSIEKWYSSASLDDNIILPSEVIKGKSYLEWICMTLLKHKDGDILRQQIGKNSDIIKDDFSKWKINLLSRNDLNKSLEEVEISESNNNGNTELSMTNNKCVDNKVEKHIREILEYEYEFKESALIKSNISVSDLKRRHEEYDNNVKLIYESKNSITPKFIKEENGLSPAERGTAIHFVMKKLDLSKVNDVGQIKTQIKELYENEFLLEEEVNVINPEKILKFFSSKLGKSMLDSNKIYREVPFYTEISSMIIDNKLNKKYKDENVRLQGIIDCFFEYNGEIILLDYKTDRINDKYELIKRYKIQLDYYSEAIFKMTNRHANKKYLYSFYLDKEIEI